MRLRLLIILLAVAVLVACGSVAGPGSDPTYATYIRLARAIGGKVLNESDASARASIDCSAGGPALWKRLGESVKTSPTDDALVRAYCPSREAVLSGQ